MLQQTDRDPAVDMAAASTELAGLPECIAETLPPHPHFHLQAFRRAGVVFSAAGLRIVNGYALLYVTDPDGRLNDLEIGQNDLFLCIGQVVPRRNGIYQGLAAGLEIADNLSGFHGVLHSGYAIDRHSVSLSGIVLLVNILIIIQ